MSNEHGDAMMELTKEDRVIALFNELVEVFDGDLGAVTNRYRAAHRDKPTLETEIEIALKAARNEAWRLEHAKDSVPNLLNDYHLGVCPECHCTDGYINVGRVHFVMCAKHHVAWSVGSNLFSSWREETDEDAAAHMVLLEQKYSPVEPWFPPTEWVEAETRKWRESRGIKIDGTPVETEPTDDELPF